MKNCLFIGQFRNLIIQINQKVLQIVIIRHKKPKKVIRFLKSYCCYSLQILNICIQRLKQSSLLRIQDVISFFTSNNLTDWVGFNQKLNNLYRLFRNEFHKLLAKLNNIFLLLLQRNPHSNILKRLLIILFILNQYFQI